MGNGVNEAEFIGPGFRGKFQEEIKDTLKSRSIAGKPTVAEIGLARDTVAGKLQLERVRQERDRFKKKAAEDTLTQLRRQDLLDPELRDVHKKWQSGELTNITLALFDLDYFSHFNDAFASHLLGDEGIRIFAIMLRDHLRDTDVPYKRGGEEFIVVFGDGKELSSADRNVMVKRVDDFRQDIEVHFMDRLQDELLDETRLAPVVSDGKVTGGKTANEKVGTIVLKEFADNVIKLREANKVDMAIDELKGLAEAKGYMKEVVKGIDIEKYKEYLSDSRAFSSLNVDEKTARRETEIGIIQNIKDIFIKRTCSAGMLFLGPADRSKIPNYQVALGGVDALLYDAKRSGRNQLKYSFGIGDNLPQAKIL